MAHGTRGGGVKYRANARWFYDAYYGRIKEIVLPERRLEHKLGQRWEPLWDFLGREVPDLPFPRVMGRVERGARQAETFNGALWHVP